MVENKNAISDKLHNFIPNNGKIDGTNIQNSWFPTIDADVFISHAHSDENIALTLAGWLWCRFRLTSFVDSCVWGYSNDLQKIIDEQFCKKGYNSNSYESRNFSTSHVHMMLASALTIMIDSAECLFFLNTPSSLSVSDIEDKTCSPWIYHELTISKYIRKRFPTRHKRKSLLAYRSIPKEARLKMEYYIDLSNLVTISESDLVVWGNHCKSTKLNALDDLYKRHPINPIKKRSAPKVCRYPCS